MPSICRSRATQRRFWRRRATRRATASRWTSIWSPPTSAARKLLVADMDSTIINVECLDELADMAGLKPQDRRHHRTRHARRAGIRGGAARARGHAQGPEAVDALERTYAERVRLNPGAKILLATMRAHGAHTMLVSGGFGFFTRRVAEAAGFHVERGNTLAGRRRGADRRSRHADPGPRSQAAGAGRSRRDSSKHRLCRDAWRWATAPTTWR